MALRSRVSDKSRSMASTLGFFFLNSPDGEFFFAATPVREARIHSTRQLHNLLVLARDYPLHVLYIVGCSALKYRLVILLDSAKIFFFGAPKLLLSLAELCPELRHGSL